MLQFDVNYRKYCGRILWVIILSGCFGLLDGTAASYLEDDEVNFGDVLSRLPGSWYEIVYPVQIRMSEVLQDLDTRDHKAKQKNAHFHSTNFEINLLGKKYRMKLELNRDLLSHGFKLKHNQDATVQVVEEMSVENCHYQGQVRRVPNSLVVVSTCVGGIRGVIILSHEVYFIQPLVSNHNATIALAASENARYPHVVYRSVSDAQTTCANNRGMWSSYKDLHYGEFLRNLKIMKMDSNTALNDAKYIQTGVVIDHSLYSQLNTSISNAVHYAVLIANIADALLNDTNMRIKLQLKLRLAYVEIWNHHDLFDVPTNTRGALASFLRYREETMTRVQFNFAHFLSGRHFDNNELGMAVADSICSKRSVAVSKSESVHDIWQASYGIVHMLAHAIGVGHDTSEHCTCSDDTGCIMSSSASNTFNQHARSWSTCSVKDIQTSILSRLTNCLQSVTTPSDVNGPVKQPEVTYEESCGNGVVERGEECDCQNNEECELTDPCCDSSTCMLKSWATCRYGECCHNCTVKTRLQMCRSAESECDVPEFCDGVSGYCPTNTLTQDGQPCGRSGDVGLCYRGVCRTYTDQCQSLWGPSSTSADHKCYETFNTAGRFNGHCGHNGSSTDYLKCAIENTRCGLLHCAGGNERPVTGHNHTFSKTVMYSDGKHYECKIINGPVDVDSTSSYNDRFGMVQDGSSCRHGSVCIGSKCVSLSHVMPVTCAVGRNGAVCSGNGVCTTDLRCYCSLGYTGLDCSEKTNVTVIPLLPTTTEKPADASKESIENLFDMLQNATTNITTASPKEDSAVALYNSGVRAGDAASTWLLFIILIVVVGLAIMILAFCLLCYRRQSPLATVQKKQKMIKRSSMTSFSSANKQTESVRLSPVASVVKFGKTPSYRAEKMKRAMKQQRESSVSESASAGRDSTEIKQTPTFPPANPPERGILKKCSLSGSVDSPHGTRLTQPQAGPLLLAANKSPSGNRSKENSSVGAEKPRVGQVGCVDEDCDDDQCSYCECSDEEDCALVLAVDESKSGCNQETQTDPDSPDASLHATDRFDSSSPLSRLCNINELLRQIDEQFNSVLQVTSSPGPFTSIDDPSPANSDEFRGSETEADRACTEFYQQSDRGWVPARSAVITGQSIQPVSKTSNPPVVSSNLGGTSSIRMPPSSLMVMPNYKPSLARDDRTWMSFKSLSLPSGPHACEVSTGQQDDADLQWKPHAFVPYRGKQPLSSQLHAHLSENPSFSPCNLVSYSPATVPSEGYHSDHGSTKDSDAPVIIREIPIEQKNALYTTLSERDTELSLLSSEVSRSPDDINV